MKISELIKQLNYELESTGDSEIYISIDIGKEDLLKKDAVVNKDVEVSGGNLFTTKNLLTSLDDVGDGVFEFGIRNWVM